MARDLVVLPDASLRRKSFPVENTTGQFKALAEEMVDFMRTRRQDTTLPVGLAAVQLGEPVRIIAFKRNPDSLDRDDPQIVINPEIIYEKGFHLVRESCLSIPGKRFTLRRAKIVKIRGLTLEGELRTFRGRDLLAQVFQHEINHLDGVLIDTLGKEVKW